MLSSSLYKCKFAFLSLCTNFNTLLMLIMPTGISIFETYTCARANTLGCFCAHSSVFCCSTVQIITDAYQFFEMVTVYIYIYLDLLFYLIRILYETCGTKNPCTYFKCHYAL